MANEKRIVYASEVEEIFNFVEHECSDSYKAFQVAIEKATTVDAVEVKHGQWISLTECANAGVYCSVCHKKVWKEDYAWCNRKNKLRSNYCPHCGAKMDGDGNDI